MERTVLRKRDISGQTVDIRIRETSPGSYALQLYVDGYYVPGPSRPLPLDPPQGASTHYLGGGYGDKEVVGITDAETTLILRSLERVERDSGPLLSQQRRALEARRKDLMEEYNRLLRRRDAEHQAALEAGRDDAEQVRQAYEARLAAAQQAIREFDREHPDVAETLLGDQGEGG